MEWMMTKRLALAAMVSVLAACGSCGDVDKKGDPFPTTEADGGDAGDDGGRRDMTRPDMDGPRDMDPNGDPTLDVQPGSLSFVDVPIGASAEQTLTVTNVGTGVLEIDGATLVEVSTDDPGGTEFTTGSQWATTAALEAGASLTLAVVYTPADESADSGYVELRTNDPALENGIHRVSLTSGGLAPDIAVPPAVVFQRVPPVNANTRDQYWQVIEVANIGGAPLDIADVIVSPAGSSFSISFPPTTTSPPSADQMAPAPMIAPNDTMPVRIFFNPIDTLPDTAELIFFSNDPDSPEAIVDLAGNSGSPCIQLSHENEINFGTGGVGFTTNRTLIIENCSDTADLNITSFGACTDDINGTCNAGGAFDVNVGTLGAAGIIGPQDTATLITSFSPTELGAHTGEFTISSDDPAKPMLEVPMLGEGTDGNACPQAIAEGRVTGSTSYTTNISAIPLQTVELRGTNSTDPDGTVASYEWTIVQRPLNSTTVLTPSNDVADPVLFLDLAGTYMLELQVVDDDNATSCGTQAFVTINAVPAEDIHVQLVWDTPTDNNQTDANGTDLDLHFLHPNGVWNNAPWDIYWLNPTAEWGAAGPGGDPSLDIDDTDGAGPENINLDGPESGTTYAIGAYYYSDNGFGPSYATIRVYVDGALEYEQRDQYMPTVASFWYAATVSWPSGDVFAVNQVSSGFP